jgi:hypothetical protein
VLHGDVHEGLGGAAERFVFAEHEREVAPDLRVGEGDRNQRLGADIFSIFERAMNPTPTSAATKRFSSSLESSSMASFGFK